MLKAQAAVGAAVDQQSGPGAEMIAGLDIELVKAAFGVEVIVEGEGGAGGAGQGEASAHAGVEIVVVGEAEIVAVVGAEGAPVAGGGIGSVVAPGGAGIEADAAQLPGTWEDSFEAVGEDNRQKSAAFQRFEQGTVSRRRPMIEMSRHDFLPNKY